ncbi:MAG: neutral zinc metallopeptidase, partial [Bacteroidales bacterium]|nr:neutral zinc metallopeptidase [Bacteroidales bacterium]
MKWRGRQGSDNVEDRRGMSPGRMAVGGGIGTIVIVLIVLLLGGDPSSLLNNMGSGAATEQYQPTAEEE